MKRWFRPAAYSIIAVLIALAVLGGKAPASGAATAAVAPRSAAAPSARQPLESLPTLRERKPAVFPVELFATARPLPMQAEATPAPVVPAGPPPVEIKVLGWMASDGMPYAFIEWQGTSYTLALNETVEDTIRFDAIGGGMASFTYLPTGEVRQYVVSNPDVQD